MKLRTTFFLLLRLMLCGLLGDILAYSVATAQIITTIAGPNNVGDGGQATLATLDDPEGVLTDAAGNTYLTEGQGNRIRRVSSSGVITTIVGIGTAGFSGDGGPATAAQINYPTSIVIDGAGNLYFSDWGNNRIRKISTAGVITTVVGNGAAGFSGDGGPATSASLNSAYGIGIDGSGVLYIADLNNNRIRKVSTAGIITTIAGTGTAGFSGDGGPAATAQLNSPTGVSVDATGNIYIGDYSNQRIRKILTDGTINTIAGNGIQGTSGDGGAATAAQISFFAGPTVDATGNVYVSDFVNSRVRKISTTGIITRVAGTTAGAGYNGDGGLATTATLSNPLGVAVDATGNLLIVDRYNQRIRRVSTAGIISTMAGPNNAGFGGDGGSALLARLNLPADVKADANGNTYIADYGNARIRRISPAGIITTVAGTSIAGFAGDNGPATSAQLAFPYGVQPDANGNIYIADTFNNRIRKINSSGIISTVAGTSFGFSGDGGPATAAQLSFPYNIAFDAAGNLYIADANNHRIRKVGTTGIITTVVGTGVAGFGGDGGAATAAQMNYPTGIAVDGANNLYIADNRNHRIRKVTAGGIISTIAGTGVIGFDPFGVGTAVKLSYPFGVVVDPVGTVFFCDNGNSCIRKLLPDGNLTTVSGSLSVYLNRGFSGDNNLATEARFSGPFGLGLDASGNLLIADSGNARIRRITAVNPYLYSVRAGNWTDPATWSGGRVPTSLDAVTLNHVVTVTAPKSATIGNSALAKKLIYASGRLSFNANGSLKIDALPVVTTVNYSGLTSTSALVQGIIYDYRVGNVYKYGICYSATTALPTLDDSFTELVLPAYQEPDSETFTTGLKALLPQTTYYARAYAKTFTDVMSYGRVLSFTTLSTNSDGITVAGGNGRGSAANQFNGSSRVYVDGAGTLYIVDTGNQRIQKWAAGATSGTTVAGGNGWGTAANQLNYPEGLSLDGTGAVYIADQNNHRVQKWAPGSLSGTTVAGGNGQGNANNQLSAPYDVYVTVAGTIYVAAYGNNRVQRWSVGASSGITVAGGISTSSLGGSGANELHFALGVYVDGAGSVYVADNYNNRIQKWAAGATSGITVAGGNGQGNASNQLNRPVGVYVDSTGAVYVADTFNHRIQKWLPGATTGITVAGGNGRGSAANQLDNPCGVFVDVTGAIYVADSGIAEFRSLFPVKLIHS